VNKNDTARYRANLQAEIDALTLYRAMAAAEPQGSAAELYRKLAVVEEKHAQFWDEKLRAAGHPFGKWTPTLRARFKVWLAYRFGPSSVLPGMAATEGAGQGMYDHQPEAAGTQMPRDERSHARVLRAMANSQPQGLEGNVLARVEGRHRAIGGNALPPALFGAKKGLF
jgi:hypothetical protein